MEASERRGARPGAPRHSVRVFVDIGAHEGQTLEEVVKPRWGFDAIYAVEPMPGEFKKLDPFTHDVRVRVVNAALSDCGGWLKMYGDNRELEASMFPEKDDVDETVTTQVLALRATDYFETVPEGDTFVKINAEGAEVPILRDLLASGEIKRIDHLLVDFDVRKIPGWGDVAFEIIAELRNAGVSFRDGFPYGINHQARIASWLAGEGI